MAIMADELLRMMRAVGDGGGQKCEYLNKGADEIDRLQAELATANSVIDTCEMWVRNLKLALKPFAFEMKGFSQETFYLCKDPQGQATIATFDATDFQRAFDLYQAGLAEDIEDQCANPS